MENISPALLEWFYKNRRSLPFREDPTPYHVWLSEVMLQQTRVSAVLPYYYRFLEALPDIPALAACGEEKLHKLWEGLGYYSRVRNLQKAAKLVCAQYGGQLPAVLRTDELCSLLQVAHPAVIAQPLPQLMQLFLPAGGKRGDIRQRFQKAVVIRQHRRHPGLLQHHLAEPHMVGGGVLPEGQTAAVLVKPLQEGRRNIFHLFCAPC